MNMVLLMNIYFFKGFTSSRRLLDGKRNFEMLKDNKKYAKLP